MNHDYQEIISKASKEIAEIFLEKEENAAARAVLSDADIAEITRQIGLETTKIVLENACDRLVRKNRQKD
jgi:ABC-type Fe3+-citrate transport system substrate-binding protein